MAMIRGIKLDDNVVLSNLKSMTDEQKIKMYEAYKNGYNHFELEAISKHIKEVSTIELEKAYEVQKTFGGILSKDRKTVQLTNLLGYELTYRKTMGE